jgi:hypothetical protein
MAGRLRWVGSWARHLGERRLLRNGRWIWFACGAFALVAVLSASDYNPVYRDEAMEPPKAPYFQGDEKRGTRGPDELRGTASDNLLFSFGGVDTVYGGDGSDLIDPGNGEDVVFAGPGDDWIRAFDKHRDVIDCGAGLDTVYLDPDDRTIACEELLERADYSLPATPSPP